MDNVTFLKKISLEFIAIHYLGFNINVYSNALDEYFKFYNEKNGDDMLVISYNEVRAAEKLIDILFKAVNNYRIKLNSALSEKNIKGVINYEK